MQQLSKSYPNIIRIFFMTITLIIVGSIIPLTSQGEDQQDIDSIYTLDRTTQEALTANIGIRISAEQTQAALYRKKSQQTAFFPSFSASYSVTRNDKADKITIPGGPENPQGLEIPLSHESVYNFSTTITQPIFMGMGILNQYKIAELGLNQARIQEAITRQDIISKAKVLYFNLLKAGKLSAVAEQSVTLLEAHRNVADNFYKVGMSPLNDLLKAEVELANARQDLVVAKNNYDIAASNLNIFLRRPVNALIEPKDTSDYSAFDIDLESCLSTAEKNRLEMRIADLDIELRKKELALTRKDYYPSVNLQGTYSRNGDNWNIDGINGNEPDSWNVQAMATWTFWEWGKTYYGSTEKKHQISQSRLKKVQIQDRITFEIKQAYLKAKESEKKILTVEKAVAQAQESHRISEERYNEQMATSTDVLDAQTLLTQTRTKYYNALYDFEISKATLDRAMGLPLQTIEEDK
jgi:outer membrane protein TolC